MTDTPGSLEERRGSANAPVPETMEGLRAQNRAYRTLCASLEAQMATLTAKGREYHEAVTTLDSEREANAILTDEIASLRARVEAKDHALTLIADRAAKLRAGTDDWFELVEFEMIARQALKDTPVE